MWLLFMCGKFYYILFLFCPKFMCSIYLSFHTFVLITKVNSFSFLRFCSMEEEDIHHIRTVAFTLTLLYYYYLKCVDRNPCMTSTQVGDRWAGELLRGHPTRFFNMFRMTQEIFHDLLNELRINHGLHGSARTTPREVLAITLYVLSQNESIRGAMERFQHSSETISRYFSVGLNSLISLAHKVVKPEDPTFHSIPSQIANNSRYMSFFKNCIGAIDGTHVNARLSSEERVAYIGRCGSPTQNVMVACDFNMCFTFVMAGWKGSARDSRVFKFATRNLRQGFPYLPQGKYYLVDVGYSLQRGYLKLYPDTKYHIPDFERSSGVARGKKEIFNKRHSSLREVTERAFGLWKKKWFILRDMSSYHFSKQVQIVIATMTLHNFIRRHPSRSDTEFVILEDDSVQVSPEGFEYHVGRSIHEEFGLEDACTREDEGASEIATLREQIADDILRS
uniref:Transposase n=1 Tax=Phalaenopsis equestris TaxID=78828 RepID=A0A410G7S3_PHAEQ|nr:transposase [Phalaenopsis equestris]